MATSYQWIEHAVYTALNAFSGNGSTASVEAILISGNVLDATSTYDQAYAPADVRKAILDQEYAIITMLCRTPGHPQRERFEVRETIDHLDKLPGSLSTHDTFLVTLSGVTKPAVRRNSFSEIQAIRDDAAMKPSGVAYYSVHGNVFYCTEDEATTVYYDAVNRSKSSSETISTLFDNSADVMRLPDEFSLPLIFLVIAQLASYADSETGQAAAATAAAEKLLGTAGVKLL